MSVEVWTFISGYLLAAVTSLVVHLVVQSRKYRLESTEWLRKERIKAHVDLLSNLEALVHWVATDNFKGARFKNWVIRPRFGK